MLHNDKLYECKVSEKILYSTLKNRSWHCSIYCHVFLKKKFVLSLKILNFSRPCILIHEPLGRHSLHWHCEIVRAGSSRMSLTSKNTSVQDATSRFSLLRLCEFFASVVVRKILRVNDKSSCLHRRHKRDTYKVSWKKREKSVRSTNTRYGNSLGFRCLRRIIATFVRLILRANSRAEFHLEAALEMSSSSSAAAALLGNIGYIMVE